MISVARRSAAALALRWHAGTGALVALAAALTLIGTLPTLTLLGGTAATPTLTLSLADTSRILADWGGRGVAWPQLQQLALLRLSGVLAGAVVLTLAVGAATLLALHVARTATRSPEVIVARSVGGSRSDIVGAMLLEAAALAGVALCATMAIVLVAIPLMRAAWPGAVGPTQVAISAAATLGVTALVMIAPLLMVRALSTTRLVDDDRRPLTLIVPALQLGAALVVLAGGVALRDLTTRQRQLISDPALSRTLVQDVHADAGDRLARAKQFSAFLAAQHAHDRGALVSLASSGMHRGFGVAATAMSDCGDCSVSGMPARYRTETVVHSAVSGDSFALSGLRIRQGRALTDADRWDAPLVAVVNASLAREMFDHGNAIGRRIQLGLLGDRWFEIVGIVDDATPRGLGSALQPRLGVYVSVLQHPVAALEVASLERALPRNVVGQIGTARGGAASMVERLAPDVRALGWFAEVLMAMGAVTAVIAIGGLIALLQLWLTSQQRELGIRRAMGASRRDIHRLVLGRAVLVAIGGSAFGAWLGQIAWDVLPRVVPGAPMWDGTAVVITALLLSLLTLAVAWILSHRFTRVPVGSLLIDVG